MPEQKQQQERTIRSHIECPDCGSSDAMTEYEFHTFCHSCQKYTKTPQEHKSIKEPEAVEEDVNSNDIIYNSISHTILSRPSHKSKLLEIPEKDSLQYKASRGISQETMRKFQVWTQGDDQYYPYYKDNGHSANKIRTLSNKGFLVQGDIGKSLLFGQQLFPSSGKTLTISEGELDALSVFEMFGSKYPSVSIKGASSAEKDVTDNFEYCNSFDQVVICFDKDDPHKKPNGDVWFPGQEAALRVAALFPLGKVRILTLQKAKDANDYIQAGWTADFIKEWWAAPVWTPVGIRLAKDLWSEVSINHEYETKDYPWSGLNEFTYGIRLSEVVLLTADTGVGKTSVLKEIQFSIRQQDSDAGIGILHLEEPNRDTLLGLMSLSANKPLHLPDVRAEVSNEELRKYYDATCDTDKIVLWDHFGSNQIDEVLNTVRYMHNLGCKYIFLDHLSIVVSDQSGDERKQLDEISTKLKKLCMELNIAIIAVIHVNRKGEVRGSAGPEQVSNIVIKLHRDKQDSDEWRRNVTKLVVEKNRFCGRTGPCCYLSYDSETGRLQELTKEQIALYEAGGVKGNTEDFKRWE